MSGWIKLHRCITSSWIYDEKPFSRLHAWIDLLLLASHKDNKFLLGAELVECKRGQVITSLRKLGEKWGWSRTKVSKYLDMLQQDNMVHVISDTRKTTISIINYDVYQSQNDTEMTPKSHGKAAEVTQKNTIKNDKNDKNVQEEYMYASGDAQVYTAKEKEPTKDKPRSPFKSKIQEARFDEFWKAHPKKRSKGQAEKAWVKVSPDAELFAKMLDGLERAKKSRDWIKDGGQYIPYPSTWLNAKGWEDDYSDIEGRPTSGLSDEDRAYIEESWARQFGEDADV